jgi:hypothetical protein
MRDVKVKTPRHSSLPLPHVMERRFLVFLSGLIWIKVSPAFAP